MVFCAVVFATTAACEDPQQTQTEAFEAAETHYRNGEYDAALDGYQAFLEAYPTSPLADTAELRIRSINREVRSVLMRKDMPRPNYTGGANNASADADTADTDPAPSNPSNANPSKESP